MFGQELLSSILQVGTVLIIALIAWAVFARKKAVFLAWIGLSRPSEGWLKPTLILYVAIVGITLPIFLFTPLTEVVTAGNTVGGQLAGQAWGLSLAGTIILMAMVKTALSEELFFRGLIAKRLTGWLGFERGNLIQAALFGTVHLLVFVVPGGPEPTFLAVAALFGIPTAAGWLMGFANHRYGGGSIAPGWLIHAGGNFVAYLSFAG